MFLKDNSYMKLKNVYILSGIILVIAAFFSTGYYHFDEHFQILEFAGFKLHLTTADNLPWEFHYQMRSAIQPAMVVLLYRFFSLFGIINPFTITFVLRLLSAGVSFTGMYLIYKTYCKSIQNDVLKKWFLFLSFFLWFMIFNGVRFSSENWSGSIFLIAFSLLNMKPHINKFTYFYLGLLFGLSFLFRYHQIGFLIAGLILWFVFIKKNYAHAFFLILGVLFMIGMGLLIDRWYYGEWTITTWNYFYRDIVQNKIVEFGTDPWWYYFEIVFLKTIPPFSIIIIASFIVVFIFRRRDILTWTILPYLLVHFLIVHKEIRYLFPIIGFVPIIIIKSVEIIQERWNPSLSDNKYVKITAKLFWITNIVALVVIAFKPADNQISLYQKLYDDYKTPATLYYTTDNPYHRILDVNFYKRSNLELKKINAANELNFDSSRKQLFVTLDKNAVNEIKARKKLIYSTLPDWIMRFDFNHWVKRTKCWYVYELY
jgi:phosphatidylinositol glycan class B